MSSHFTEEETESGGAETAHYMPEVGSELQPVAEAHGLKDALLILHIPPLPAPGADLYSLLTSASSGVRPLREIEGEERGIGDLLHAHPCSGSTPEQGDPPPRSSLPHEPMSSLLLGTQDGEASPSFILLTPPQSHHHQILCPSAFLRLNSTACWGQDRKKQGPSRQGTHTLPDRSRSLGTPAPS